MMVVNLEDALKKCPFCGSDVEVENLDDTEDSAFFMMHCLNTACDCAVSFGDSSETKDAFVQHWNSRFCACKSKSVRQE